MIMQRKARSNAAAVEATIKALGEALDESHAALVQAARSLAVIVDDPSGAGLDARSLSSMWQRYQASVDALLRVGAGGGVDEEVESFRVSIQTPVPAKVRDAKVS